MTKLTLLLLTLSLSVKAQDAVLVTETCKKITELKDPGDLSAQGIIVSKQLLTYAPTIENTPKEERVKALYTFHYRLHRELRRTCAQYRVDLPPRMAQRIVDLEDIFTRPQIDSLTNLCGDLGKSKDIFVYIVTIDDYFPDTNITSFSNRNREWWGQRGSYDKGNVLIAVSTANREMRISTSDVSMKFLSDEKCTEINSVIISHFKDGKFFEGLVAGLNEIKKNL